MVGRKRKNRNCLMDSTNEVNVASSTRHWALVIVMNVLVLAELCIAMHQAASSTEDFTATFIKVFFGLLIPTLIVGAVAKRRLRFQPAKA
jgi:flagellar biosynthesis protein FliQ